MFFSQLFKNRKGDVESVSDGIFNIAVVLNIVCLSIAIMLLLGCFFVKAENVQTLIILSIMVVATCYVIEVFLAWSSILINHKEDKKPIKRQTKSKQ